MRHRVTVTSPRGHDDEAIAALLGEQPLELPIHAGARAPFISIDGRIHGPSADFLSDHLRDHGDLIITTRMARDLSAWVEFLCNECELEPNEGHLDPTFLATEAQFNAYWGRSRNSIAEHALTDVRRARAVESIAEFHDHLERVLGLRPPFDARQHLSAPAIDPDPADDPVGVPLTPRYVDFLLLGAKRIGIDGTRRDHPTASRDEALLSLGLASGLRSGSLAELTVHELPPISSLPITRMGVSGRSPGSDREPAAFVLTNRLRPVHDYVHGSRRDASRRSGHLPAEPLDIVDATASVVSFIDRTSGAISTRPWTEVSSEERRRLVDLDGGSAALFLDHRTGAPLARSVVPHIVAGARDFTREQIEPDFPRAFGVADLRTTYAAHMAVVMLNFVVTDGSTTAGPTSGSSWTDAQIESAVRLVRGSLGEFDDGDDHLSVDTVRRFLDIPVDRFLAPGGGGLS